MNWLRIDDRLVHGQVVEGWVRALRLVRLVVASDTVACDATQQALFSLAVPQGVDLICASVARVAEALQSGAWAEGKTMVLVSNPQDALALISAGAPMRSVNVGGMHYRDGRIQVIKAISVDAQDVEAFQALRARGVTLEARPLPLDEPVDLGPYLDRWMQSRELPR